MQNAVARSMTTPSLLELCGGVGKIFIIWSLVSVTDAFRAITYMRTQSRPIAYVALSLYAIVEAVMWTLITLFLLWLVDGWRDRGRLVSMLRTAIVLIACVMMTIGVSTVMFSLTGFSKSRIGDLFLGQLARNFHSGMLVIVIVLIAAINIRDRSAAEAGRLRETRLENELMQAQLRSVSAQFQPHFLFNILHGVSAMMHKDVALAERMLSGLGDLLRLSLSSARQATGPLDDELYFVERYLFLQQMRIGERLQVRVEASDEARRSQFPRFALQPLVENAIKHGIERLDQPGEIEIVAAIHGERLQLRVSNTAPKLEPEASEGVGLASVRTRLELIYGAAHKLELTRQDGMVGVTIAVPQSPSTMDSRLLR